jgi:hypothetical protein
VRIPKPLLEKENVMKPARMMPAILFVVLCIGGGAWSYACLRYREKLNPAECRKPMFDGSSLRLKGTLIPPHTVEIGTMIQMLDVPVKS